MPDDQPSIHTDDFLEKEEIEKQKRKVYRSLTRENDRLVIKSLLELTNNKKNNLAGIAKKLDKRASDIEHNLYDLIDNGWVKDDTIQLTNYGKEIYQNFELFLEFMIQNKEYFNEHDFGNLPLHFKTSIGSLKNCFRITGKDKCIKVQRKEREIIENSEKYVYNLLSGGRYDSDLINSLIDKAKNRKFFEIRTILRRDAIEPPEDIQKMINEKLKPTIKKNKGKLNGPKKLREVKIAVVMNEKEAMITFPYTGKDEPDMCEAFYGNNEEFHQWCLDYFRHCWEKASDS